ncbi:MAG: universal stress protein [Pseudomonadota bacterium]
MDQLSPIGRLQRVLVATDGSEYSVGAVQVAIAMCVKGGASLTAMTAVISAGDLDGTVAADAQAELEARASAVVDEVQAQAMRSGIECDKVVRFGDDPYQEILAESEHVNADMIVVGRRGKRGLARLMLGDATLKVIGNAKCSVMVVPKAAGMWTKRVLLATDGSRSADAAAVLAARISQCCGTPITVLSVEVPSHSPQRQAEAWPTVKRVAEFLANEGATVDAVVERGEPHHVIIDTARAKGADLIVMGSHGRTGLGRLLLGSNSERVIGQATCPVLVVKGT